MKVALVIPTYNERENIIALIPAVLRIFSEHSISGSIIVVDDSSPDGTGNVVNELSERLGNVILVSRKEKLGLGSAYRTGFSEALSLGFDGIMEMDADGQHDPLLIPKFVRKLNDGFDLIIGSRYIIGGEIGNWPLERRLISKSASLFVRFLFKSKIRDPTSGYRIFSRRSLETIHGAKLYTHGYTYQVEMAVRYETRGF
ncbi:MAG: dolichol-phosphate mannosyltransferase, partial [Thermoproteota archaeon]|nr:dolichol-phosphate mannosyltransferase [Thermoproteota archaeon]